MRAILVAAALFVSGTVFAHKGGDPFMPANNLHLEDHKFIGSSQIDETLFNDIITKAEEIYAPIVEAQGGNLKFSRGWKDPTVNASASQIGKTWQVNMYGGLARRPEVTPDGFALVVCHELGHHLGGFAFYDKDGWAASEGQSDYFATHSCARMMWGNEPEVNAKAKETADPYAVEKCDESWTEQADRDLCYRAAMGGKSLAKLLGTLGGNGNVEFNTPDDSVVRRTDPTHPKGQCRLDTYFAGALCGASFDPSVIPGRNHEDGQLSLGAQEEAAKASCMEGAVGLRPRCWFAPVE